jgi:hypothetical protein
MRTYNRHLVHGTLSGYLYRGCRCERCRQANRDYYGQKPLAEHLAAIEPPHGTESRYSAPRCCRCTACRAAATAARARRRACV